MPGDTRRRYPPELKERAVRMVAEIQADEESEWAAMTRVSELLGVGTPETVRKWVRRAEIDAGARPGVTSEESAEVRRLRREVAELRRANSILKAGGCRTNRRRGSDGCEGRSLRIVVWHTISWPGIAIS
jgi:transposase